LIKQKETGSSGCQLLAFMFVGRELFNLAGKKEAV
jgi:hypothetical protein